MSTADFYDRMASVYHLLFPEGIDQAIGRHGQVFKELIRENWGERRDVIDVSCGIGTQSIGLARLGYNVTASDLSYCAIERARKEAMNFGVDVRFSVGDMRQLQSSADAETFDVVLTADSAIQHLKSEAEILESMRAFYTVCRTGGGAIVTARDFEAEGIRDGLIRPYKIKTTASGRHIIIQNWEADPPYFNVAMYFIEDTGGSACTTQVMRCSYLPVSISRLMELLTEAGFRQVKRNDETFFQPVLVASKI